ncbi:MAG: hypothetical protein A2289_00725 [Deltaproteobacteria bacterium RIFOXYA12_FULL_58_15]|nr:MAG: hypothetical protein A2289_00725 [Deltaproteobacteria bacterium RIFOXYA12_FULL_58_15]OGR08525.1 MAG: hypothetical protein A2341_25260 [Deltaproteobacteria bacterium RIFOXYB12_FULL_58_9]
MRRKFILGVASWGGLGYLPKGPGTWGTLGAIPLWWVLATLERPVFVAVCFVFVGVAILVSHEAEKIYGSHDVGHIVIDEVAGLLVTVVGVPCRWPEVLAAFVLFRLLDIVKPWPIGWIDRRVPGGAGVVLDDVAAGVIGCLVLHAARLLLGGWW